MERVAPAASAIPPAALASRVAAAAAAPPHSGSEQAWKPSVGGRAEVALPDEGLEGSWYSAEVLGVRGGGGAGPLEAHVRVAGLLADGEGEAGLLEEWHTAARLRPPPPPPPADFPAGLKPGSIAEVWHRRGWWPVSVLRAVGEVGVWELELCGYEAELRAPARLLRPSWRWEPAGRRGTPSWSIAEKPSAAGKAKAKAKRRSSELLPGTKGAEQEGAARGARELLHHFAPGTTVEIAGVEDGFFGSWYTARVLETREARGAGKLRVRYDAFREDDGSTWEDWVELEHVRPLPPRHKPQFVTELDASAPLELLFKEGWWEASVLPLPLFPSPPLPSPPSSRTRLSDSVHPSPRCSTTAGRAAGGTPSSRRSTMCTTQCLPRSCGRRGVGPPPSVLGTCGSIPATHPPLRHQSRPRRSK